MHRVQDRASLSIGIRLPILGRRQMIVREWRYIVLLLAVIPFLLGAGAQDQTKAREALRKGVEAHRDQKFQTAMDYFREAISLDPELTQARMYLATTLASQYVRGVESEKNKQLGEEAIKMFKEVLEKDPDEMTSVAGIASMCFYMGQFEEARKWYKKRAELDWDNPEAVYSVGVVDWTLAYKANVELRLIKLERLPAGNPLPPTEREEFKVKFGSVIEDGLDSFLKAVELRPDYSDAMAYLNLMYRLKADIESDNGARDNDLKEADSWLQKAKDTRSKESHKEREMPPR
jgi:tetratricopeptide (TPR) repeat protein